MSDPFDMRTRKPRVGSVEPESPDELSSFTMRKTDRDRVASGVRFDFVADEQPQRDYAIDDYTVEKQDEAKQTPDDGPDRRSPYNHPHVGGRGSW
jgi:hypothetical protein